jgi:hypothetical protein
VWGCGLDSTGCGQCSVTGFCEHGNGPSSSIKGQLGCCQLSRRLLGEILGSHGDECEGGDCLLECRPDDGGSKLL